MFANCEWPAKVRTDWGRKRNAALRTDGPATQAQRQGATPRATAERRKSDMLQTNRLLQALLVYSCAAVAAVQMAPAGD